MTAGEPGEPDSGCAVPEGLSWSWAFDVETLLAALSEPAPWNRPIPGPARPTPPTHGDETAEPEPANTEPANTEPANAEPANTEPANTEPANTEPANTEPANTEPSHTPDDPIEAEFADYLDARDTGRSVVVPLPMVAGRVAELLPASPDLAAWLSCHPAGDLEDGALAGVVAAFRRVASWAQAGELAAVAEMASRSAASDRKCQVDERGRPDKVPADAYGQVSLALTMSQAGAEWWTDLAVNLRWRLAATGAALSKGTIDLSRAKAIADLTAPLDDDQAKAVEAKVLPKAEDQTIGQLRASLRRAVIAADPEGAERRREEAERRAKVSLYPDADGTASLGGQSLPGIQAAAAMARLTALARALKASGTAGGIDLLRSKVFLGLLLGTLPHIPPPPDGPADADCPPETGPHGGGTPDDDDQPGGSSPLLDDWPWPSDPASAGTPSARQGDTENEGFPSSEGNSSSQHAADDEALPPSEGNPDEEHHPDDRGFPPEDEQCRDSRPYEDIPEDEPVSECGPARPMPWPDATPFLPPGPAALGNLAAAGSGFLDLRVPWSTLTAGIQEPGYLTRLGPITPAQANYLALLAAKDPAAEWRVVVTDSTGRATAITRVRRRQSVADPDRAGPGGHSSLVARVTVIISTGELSTAPGCGSGSQQYPGPQQYRGSHPDEGMGHLLAAITTAARGAAQRAAEQRAADTTADGCAHLLASPAYQVPVRLREFVTVRDLTCRFPTCRQPAWRCDADHTKPYDQDGPTCCCNLGALCRHHHKLKQHALWRLDQPAPGTFTWTTPTGRTYTIHPDVQAA